MKKAQGLSLETIIIAAILLATAIILIFIVSKQGGIFGKNITDCQAQQGVCVSSAAACIQQGGQPMSFSCPKETPACCKT